MKKVAEESETGDEIDGIYTDYQGQFDLYGRITAATRIKPGLEIYHDCENQEKVKS